MEREEKRREGVRVNEREKNRKGEMESEREKVDLGHLELIGLVGGQVGSTTT
jgi:hypothetical protein